MVSRILLLTVAAFGVSILIVLTPGVAPSQTISPTPSVPTSADTSFTELRNSPHYRSVFFSRTGFWLVHLDYNLIAFKNGVAKPVSSGAPKASRAVTFLDSLRGWDVAWDGTIWETADGGETWMKINDSRANPDGFGSTESLRFLSERLGWILTDFEMCRTRDGGLHWEPPIDLAGTPMNAFFLDENVGWTITSITNDERERLKLYRTRDGGDTWDWHVLPNRTESESLFFLTSHLGWLADQSGGLYRTTDGGSTWKSQKRPRNGVVIESIWWQTPNKGWLAGYRVESKRVAPMNARAVLLQTLDGGSHWTNIDINTVEPFFSRVTFVSSDIGWLAGRDLIYGTADGGVSWKVAANLSK